MSASPTPATMTPAPITVCREVPAQGDVIFLPTDLLGTPGELNGMILAELGLPEELPGEGELGFGYRFRPRPGGLLCYIVTVGLEPAADALPTFLGRALRAPAMESARSIWLPLMGTGAGGLTHPQSLELTLGVLIDSGWLRRHAGRHATIALPGAMRAGAAEEIAAILEGHPDAALIGSGLVDEDVYALPMSAAATEALRAAGGLAMRNARRLSSSLLFLTLAESQEEDAPRALRDDAGAELFGLAVREQAGERYARVRADYLGGGGRPEPADSGTLPQPTGHVSRILHVAHAAARERGGTIETDDLIDALLDPQDAALGRVLSDIGIDLDQLRRDLADARLGLITTKFRNDVAAEEDRLGYDGYASAIVAFLTHADTPPPLSISIQAPWGAGKSSLMNLVREKLDPKAVRERHTPRVGEHRTAPHLGVGAVLTLLDRREAFSVRPDPEPVEPGGAPVRLWTVWFNAWKYETSEQVWAGMIDAIVSQIAERLPLIEREKFLLKLQLARIDDGIVRRRIYDRIARIWWSTVRGWTLAGLSALASLAGLRAAAPAMPTPIAEAIMLLTGSGAVAVPVGLSLYLIASYVFTRRAVRAEPATFSLADYIRVPDYDRSVGEIHQIHADLRRVLGVVPRHREGAEPPPIVIFIDDLDRCSPGKVAGVVEGVSMLLASDTYRCMFVIGMDPQMVAAALETAHEDVRRQLPRYERAVPLGWRFMDKFIQLPFTIPPAPAARFGEYLHWLSDVAAPAPASTVPASTPADVPAEREGEGAGSPASFPASLAGRDARDDVNRAALARRRSAPVSAELPAAPAFTETRDVGAIVRAITRDAIANPREMKRIVNLARFYLALRAARRAREPAWRPPAPPQYARWIAATLRWPDMMRWLQWGADEASWDDANGDLVVRRLRRLEAIAASVLDLQHWKGALATNLLVPAEAGSDWGCDPKLFEFFRAEAALPASLRLSAAAERGFW